jgi:hypothetical protein
MGTLVFARRARWLDGGVFTWISRGTIAAKVGGHRFITARSKEKGMREYIEN